MDIRIEAEFPTLLGTTRLHLGVLLTGLAAIAVWLLMRRTTLGFQIRSVGANARAAAHGGIAVGRVMLLAAAISGGLAGLAGVGEVAGLHFQVMASLSPGYGYTGIVVAMLAALNPLGVVPSALFFAAIATGAESMSRQTGVPVFLGDVIQGTSLICMLAALLFTGWRLRPQDFDVGDEHFQSIVVASTLVRRIVECLIASKPAGAEGSVDGGFTEREMRIGEALLGRHARDNRGSWLA